MESFWRTAAPQCLFLLPWCTPGSFFFISTKNGEPECVERCSVWRRRSRVAAAKINQIGISRLVVPGVRVRLDNDSFLSSVSDIYRSSLSMLGCSDVFRMLNASTRSNSGIRQILELITPVCNTPCMQFF